MTAVTVTNAYPVKRAIKSPVSCDCADDHLEHLTKRTFSTTPIALVVTLSTPTPLATFADDILSTACSAEVQPATTTALAIVTTFPFRSTLETISASLSLKTSTHSTKTKIRTITSGIATIASTTTTTIGYLSTTTITIQATAPTGLVTYLQILPAINNPDSYALSDPATHMTDNDFLTGSREVFIVTNTSQLYSVTHDAYYYRGDGSNGGKLYWSSNPADGEHIFFQRPDLAVGYNQLFLNYTTNTPAVFCLMEASSGDGNSATGLHVRFYPTAADYIAQCDAVKLYLQPV